MTHRGGDWRFSLRYRLPDALTGARRGRSSIVLLTRREQLTLARDGTITTSCRP
ncbi:MAG: hypothetical protein HC923_10385 [Myxococcales bacterium]|nr:hypothetical protein [Myxococcales bacterium]